jgi:signal transduction histidine kinase
MPSLRRKIVWGFYAFAVAIAAVAVFAWLDLRYVERRITAEVAVSHFTDAVLEMRRYEKNYFLYRSREDHDTARDFALRAASVLKQDAEAFRRVVSTTELLALESLLTHYLSLLESAQPVRPGLPVPVPTQDAIRETGRLLIARAEDIARQERAALVRALSQSRIAFFASLSAIVVVGALIAHWLARAAAQPLALLETQLRAIGAGRFDHVEPTAPDREIVSVAAATNRMLSEIDARRRQLVQSEKLASLGTLVSGVAHELNNPLSNISTSCQLALEELPAGSSSELREWLQQADAETQRARDIVRTLLEFSRERSFSPSPVNLRDVVNAALLLLGKRARTAGSIEIAVPDGLVVTADGPKLQQVMVNLVNNALDSAPRPVHVRIAAEMRWLKSDESLPTEYLYARAPCMPPADQSAVFLTISDNGLGIPSETLPRIFDPFFTTKEVGHGSGLGLYVSQEIVHQHEGCIGVASDVGRGTRFLIVLPQPQRKIT